MCMVVHQHHNAISYFFVRLKKFAISICGHHTTVGEKAQSMSYPPGVRKSSKADHRDGSKRIYKKKKNNIHSIESRNVIKSFKKER